MKKLIRNFKRRMNTEARIVLSILFAIVLVVSTAAYKTQAAGLPFGGFVTLSIPCTCSTGMFLLTIGPPTAGQYIYQTGTQAFLNYNLPRPGVWALGLFVPGGVCMVYAGKSCVAFGLPVGTITSVTGTSI